MCMIICLPLRFEGFLKLDFSTKERYSKTSIYAGFCSVEHDLNAYPFSHS